MLKRLGSCIFIVIISLSVIGIFSLEEIPLHAQQPESIQQQGEEQTPQQPESQPVYPKRRLPRQQFQTQPQEVLPQTVQSPDVNNAKEVARRGEVSFFFDDADIFEVAQTVFGDVLRVNYIIDPKVKGRVNFRTVTPIPRDEVLPVMEVILRLNGIGFVEEKGLYRIIPLTEVSKELVYSQVGKPPERVAIELFTFKNLNLQDSMAEIESAIGLHLQGGTVRILPIYRLNALVVVASTKEHLEYIRKWVELLDSMFIAARPKVFVYPLQNTKATHVASLLQSIFSGGAPSAPSTTPKTELPKTTAPTPSAPTAPATTTPPSGPKTGAAAVATGTGFLVSPETRVFADEVANSLIILATPSDYKFIEETIKKIDILPRQVMIEALIAEVRLTDAMTFGLEWSLKTDINIKGFRPFDRDINLTGDLASKSGLDTTTGGFTFLATDAAGIVRAKLQALATDNRVRVLSSPHILVSDNREARIQIGDQVPIATSQTVSTGVTPAQTTTTIQYKDTGTILKVKPQVNESGLIALEITQEVSDFSTRSLFGSDQIIISKREATTNLVAHDGQTVVIGGLIKDKTTKSKTGIPLLSKIPILGYLFGKTTDEDDRTELIILLTTRVIRTQKEAVDVSSDYIKRLKGVGKEIEMMQESERKEKGQKEPGKADENIKIQDSKETELPGLEDHINILTKTR